MTDVLDRIAAYKREDVAACAAYVAGAYKAHRLAPLWCDFILVRDGLSTGAYDEGCAMRDRLVEELAVKYASADR